jgi:hypothetical protein
MDSICGGFHESFPLAAILHFVADASAFANGGAFSPTQIWWIINHKSPFH